MLSDLHLDYYASLNVILARGATVNETTEFNYYFPVKITSKFDYAFLGLISSTDSFLTVNSVFKLYGSIEKISFDWY